MRIGNLLDHLQSARAAPAQPGGRRFPDSIDDQHGRGVEARGMEGRPRGPDDGARIGPLERWTARGADDLRHTANAVVENLLSPRRAKSHGIGDRIGIASHHGQPAAGHEGIGHGVYVAQACAGRSQAIADRKPGQQVRVGDAGRLGVLFPRVSFLLGGKDDFNAADEGGGIS